MCEESGFKKNSHKGLTVEWCIMGKRAMDCIDQVIDLTVQFRVTCDIKGQWAEICLCCH